MYMPKTQTETTDLLMEASPELVGLAEMLVQDGFHQQFYESGNASDVIKKLTGFKPRYVFFNGILRDASVARCHHDRDGNPTGANFYLAPSRSPSQESLASVQGIEFVPEILDVANMIDVYHHAESVGSKVLLIDRTERGYAADPNLRALVANKTTAGYLHSPLVLPSTERLYDFAASHLRKH